IDTTVGIRKRVQPGLGDLLAAELTTTVNTFDDPHERPLDLLELSALDLDDLRADLVVGGIHRGINVVTDHIELGKFTEAVEIPIQGLAQRVTASDQPRMESKQSIFAGHVTPPGVHRS